MEASGYPAPHDSLHGRRVGLVQVAAAVVEEGGRVLLAQRPPGGPHGLLWEFPGGKIEPGESAEHALVREIQEELGVTVAPREVLAVETHDYPHGPEVEIQFLRCHLVTREVRLAPEVHAVRWVVPAEVDPASMLAADRPFLAKLAARPVR
jgi:8-oxo-dGTP diphosphatase